MREQEFAQWMLESGYNRTDIAAILVNLHKIMGYEGSLDGHFREDGCRKLLRKFRYSLKDREAGVPPQHSVPIDKDPLRETESLKRSLKFYMDFCTCTQQMDLVRRGEALPSPRKLYT